VGCHCSMITCREWAVILRTGGTRCHGLSGTCSCYTSIAF
jgi:hypothetical protein